jgi:excisionase family DNA binding protein
MASNERTYSVTETAHVLGVHPESVRRMIRDRRLHATRVRSGRGSGYRIPASVLEGVIPETAAVADPGGRQNPLQHRARGKFLLRFGELKKAEAAYDAALQASLNLRDPLGEAKASYKLGQIALRSGDLERAQHLYRRAEALFTELHDRDGLQSVLLAQGDLALELPEPDLGAAADRYRKALDIATNLSSSAGAERGLGAVAHLLGKHEESRRHLAASLELAVRGGDLPAQANSARCLAKLEAEEGSHGQAAALLRSALDIYHRFGFRRREEMVRSEIAELEASVRSAVRGGRAAALDSSRR